MVKVKVNFVIVFMRKTNIAMIRQDFITSFKWTTP